MFLIYFSEFIVQKYTFFLNSRAFLLKKRQKVFLFPKKCLYLHSLKQKEK